MELNVRKNVLFLLSASMLFYCVVQILVVSSGLIIKDITGSLVLANLATSIIYGADILVVFQAEVLSDKIGRRKVLLIGVVLALLALVLIIGAFLKLS
jgi:MFS family permease